MTLDGFLLLVMALLAILLAFYRPSRLSMISKSPIPYFIVIALAMLGSYWTFIHYAKSHGGYYKNTEYHIIQQEGFKYSIGQTLLLASDQSPDKAILETGVGELLLDGEGQFQSKGFVLPLYVEDLAKPMRFHVINTNDDLSMENGDEIMVKEDDKLLLKIKYEEIRDGNKIQKYRFVFSVRDTIADTWERNSFRQGYSLADMLQTRLDASTRSLFENCYLIRNYYDLDVENPKNESGKVYLIGANKLVGKGATFYKNGNLLSPNLENNIKNEQMNGRRFFYGLGTTRSQVYIVAADAKNISVLYRLPKMYHFPEGPNISVGESNLFLTTDKQEIINLRDKFDCFYQFCDKFDENSIYKASAAIDFMIDSAGVSLNPQYYDMNEDVDHTATTPIEIGTPFEIRTLSCRLPEDGIAHVSFLFSIQDMRKNEVYTKVPMLYIVTILMLLVIYIMLHLLNTDKKSRINKLYIVETSVYLTMVAFLTVRLVMLWRLHTFPPIENVSRHEFDKLTNPDIFIYTLYSIVGILALRIIILFWQLIVEKKWGFNFNDWVDEKMDENVSIPPKWIIKNFQKKGGGTKNIEIPIKYIVAIIMPPMLYLLCRGLMGLDEKMVIVIKEAIAPLLAFAINSIFYVYRIRISPQKDKEEYKRRGVFCWSAIIWNTMVFLVFLLLPESKLGFGENGMLLPMVGVFMIWYFITIIITPTSRKWFRWMAPVFIVLLLVLVFWHVPLAQTSIGKRFVSNLPESLSRAKDRIVAASETPSEMMQNQHVEFQDKTMQDILNASSNKWFIDNHLSQRYYLVKNKHGFILDKEYNQRAVSYTTQTRDVVLLRYLMYEHGNGVVKKLLWVMLLLSVNVYVVYKRKNERMPFLQQLPLQSSLFLLLYSSYLFLVNMNAVVFVGLDFPFLTLTSKVAPLGLLLPLLAILLPVNIKRQDESLVGEAVDSKPDWGKLTAGVLTAAMMVGLVVLPSHRMEKQIKKNNGKSSASFSVSMEPLAVFVNEYINPKLRDFQDDNDENTKVKKEKFENMSIESKGLKDRFKNYVMGEEDGNSLIDNQLKLFAKQTKWANDTTFIRSAFKKSFNTSMTDPKRNIIHLRKLNGRFLFVTNKVYYDMKPMFNNSTVNEWHGDLLAAAGATRLTFTGENHKEAITLRGGFYVYGSGKDTDDNNLQLRGQFLGENTEKNINFTIVQIPKEYCYIPEVGDHDVYILKPVDAPEGKSYIIYPSGDATNPIKENNMALWIKPNDIVKVSGSRQSFSFNTEGGNYFSKRIHYNGKYQAIYPLGDRFIFAYNFDQMLAENYHPSVSPKQSVRISLDYDLLNDVYDYCESTMALGKSRAFGNGVTITAIDGNGRIRLLADYNPKRRISVDPNQARELSQIMEDIYLNGNMPEERALLQNRNLTRMSIGPGSTIKVPLYVAIAAESNIDWTKFSVYFPGGCVNKSSGKAVVEKYGNYPTKGIHKGVNGWDELSSEYKSGETMNANSFITTSNNFFFGSIIGLGTYSSTQLYNGIGGALVKCTSPKEAVFPNFCFDGQYYKFKERFVDDFGDDRTLENSLNENFRFLRWQSRDYGNQTYDVGPTNFLFYNDTTQTQKTRTRTTNSLYVYSERPNLHREIETIRDDDVIKGFLHLTSGGAKHLNVTPLNMAEAYLRIALLNGAENVITYDDNTDSIPYKPFETVHDNFAEQMKSTTFLGMWNVLSGAGTLKNEIDKKLKNEYGQKEKPIYVYGKTGTVGDLSVQKHDNYHYAFILSNKRLDEQIDRRGLKVYVVYFGYYDTSLGGHGGTATTRKAILDRIIMSETFQNYWNDETKVTSF